MIKIQREKCLEIVEPRDIKLGDFDAIVHLRNVPWYDYDPEVLNCFKQKWRNYIKPGFDINVGNVFHNYDFALRDPHQAEFTTK